VQRPLIYEYDFDILTRVHITLDEADLRFISYARKGLQRYGLAPISHEDWKHTVAMKNVFDDNREDYKKEKRKQVEYIVRRCQNWPPFDRILSKDKSQFFFFAGLCLAGMIYGGAHALAWNAQFATRARMILWRISSVAIAAPGLYLFGAMGGMIFIVIPFLPFISLMQKSKTLSKALGVIKPSLTGIGVILLVILFIPTVLALLGFIPLYLLARFYIVVESFLSLGYLPTDVFEIPQWSQYFPHVI